MDDSTFHGIFWNHLVYPEMASAETEDPAVILSWVHERLPGGRWPEYVACLAMDGLDSVESVERRETVRRVREIIQGTLPPSQCALLGFAHTNTLYFCGCLQGTEDEARPALIEKLEAVNRCLADTLAISGTVGLAMLPDASMDGLQWAAQRAVVAMRQKVRTGANRVYFHDPCTPATALDLGAYWSLAQRMHAAVRSGNRIDTDAALNETVSALFEATYLSLSHMRPMLQCQVIFMAQAAADVGADPDQVACETERLLAQIGSAYDYDRLRGVLTEAAHAFTRMVHNRFHGVGHRLVAAVDDQINAHLLDVDLGLQQIADHIGASPAHVSRTYKKVKGIGVTRAIQERRVEGARRMLLDPGVSITDVAFSSGFSSLQQFGRVFREVTGVTPTDYRAKMAQSSANAVLSTTPAQPVS